MQDLERELNWFMMFRRKNFKFKFMQNFSKSTLNRYFKINIERVLLPIQHDPRRNIEVRSQISY